MFVLYNKENQKIPIKVWLQDQTVLEPECLAQAMNLANLPFGFRHVSLMPDTHTGYGMPIGGVLATEGVIIPNAVGVDIGCGMGFVHTNIPVAVIKKTDTPNGKLVQQIIGAVMREIPTGFAHHKQPQECVTLDQFNPERGDPKFPTELVAEIRSRLLPGRYPGRREPFYRTAGG